MHAQAGCFVQVEETQPEAASLEKSSLKALGTWDCPVVHGVREKDWVFFSESLLKMTKRVLCGENPPEGPLLVSNPESGLRS